MAATPQQPKTTTKKLTITHTKLARAYIDRRKMDRMFTRGAWYSYAGGAWSETHDLVIENELWNHLEAFEAQNQCRPTAYALRSVQKRIMAQLFVDEAEVDAYPNLINLRNGIYDTQTGELLPHNPDLYLTTQLPFVYDPAATTSMWDVYLLTTFVEPRSTKHDPELEAFAQEAVGYSLTTSIQHHVAFWCHGEGANGKGVLFHVLEELGGNGAIPVDMRSLRRERYQLADLAGKRIAMCSESSAHDSLVEDAIIKTLVSGDTMRVRQIHRQPFSLHPTAKLWWAMNTLPSVADTSEGFWRRTRVIPFNREFKEKERILDLKEQLSLELPGIFNWAMIGLKRLQERGHFIIPQQVGKATAQYQKDSNPLALFVEERCILGKDKEVQSSTIYPDYKGWCKDNTYRSLSNQKFKREMERLGYFLKKKPSANFFQGIAMKWVP